MADLERSSQPWRQPKFSGEPRFRAVSAPRLFRAVLSATSVSPSVRLLATDSCVRINFELRPCQDVDIFFFIPTAYRDLRRRDYRLVQRLVPFAVV